MRQLLKHYWFVFTWGAVIAVLSVLPANNKDTGWFDLPNLDKLMHFLFYSILTLLLMIAFTRQSDKKHPFIHSVLHSFIIVLFYGLILEFIQHFFIDSRTGDSLDVVCNMAGFLFAAIIILIVRARRSKTN